MAKLYDLTVVTGTYEKDGETKKRYQNIGVMMSTKDGGQYILLDPLINLAAVPRKDGSDRVMVSMFEPKDDKKTYGDEQFKAQTSHSKAKADGYVNDPAMQGPLDDSIPF